MRKLIKQRIVVLIITTVCIFISGCNKENKKKLNSTEYKIVKNCIDYIKKNNDYNFNNKFVVEPYFNHFVISNFFDHSAEKFISLFKDGNKEKYKKMENNINKIYAGQFNQDLLSFSEAESANYVISFSGFGENVIMGYINYNSNIITKSIKKEDYKTDGNNIDYFIFLLDDDSDIEKVITTAITIG